ncbi:MAG: ribbon-helix-helix protein, CopG family [bacterium]
MAATKLTVSISQETYDRLEEIKKENNLNRSELVQKIIKQYLEIEDEKKLIKDYISGYKRIPENDDEWADIEKTQLSVLDKEF